MKLGLLTAAFPDLTLDDPLASNLPRVQCVVSTLEDGRLALVRFRSPQTVSACDAALALLKHPAADPDYVEVAADHA